MRYELYHDQQSQWPHTGRHILAQFDDDSIIVYQAYRPDIGRYAAKHGHFGGEFSYSRMSWIKPNFLWMMYRSGWGTKSGQEVTLAIRLRRSFFGQLLADAVPSSWDRNRFSTESEWSKAVASSDVRLQWDPDHSPSGSPLARRAVQLGLRGQTLDAFGKREILEIQDISSFVAEQNVALQTDGIKTLLTPMERVFRLEDDRIASQLGIDTFTA